jgi:outer membrane protein assembly factor BamB
MSLDAARKSACATCSSFGLMAGLGLVLICAGCGGSSTTSQTGSSTVAPAPSAPQTPTNVLTFHNDIARTGQNLTETVLTHAVVNSSSFGKLFSVAVDGKVDAQPLYVSQLTMPDQQLHSVVFAATEHDSVYAFDAKNGTIYWHVSLLLSGEVPSDDLGCSQVTPEIGITATPVIDLTAGPHGTIYLLAMSKDGAGNYHHRLHALDITTGQEEFGGPVEISATYPGTGDNSSNGQVVFDPRQYNSRPGLLLLNGVVYTGWGSHCDFRPYTGWLIGYDRLTLKQTSVFNFAPNGSEGALWNSGAGMSADAATGQIFVAVGNGTFDTTLNASGFPNRGDFGNSFLRLGTANNQLMAEDYWTMSNTLAESAQDEDLGSGGVLLLPDLTNASGQTVKLGTGAGKDGKLYVFNRANMGKFNPANDSGIYQELSGALGGDVFSTPAWFNGTVYYGAVGDRIRAFGVNAAMFSSQPSSMTDNFFEYPGATPSISANGTSDAILWAVENANPAVLHAYDATNLTDELYNSNQASSGRDQFGPGNKYIVPTIADGRVFVGTTNSVVVFGRIS